MGVTRKKERGDYSQFKPLPVSGPNAAFGVVGDKFRELAPMYIDYHEVDVPEEFYNGHTLWNKVVSGWFFEGLPPKCTFDAKDGIDAQMAFEHVSAVLRSFEPGHNEKEAMCAYLLSLWFNDFEPGEGASENWVRRIKDDR